MLASPATELTREPTADVREAAPLVRSEKAPPTIPVAVLAAPSRADVPTLSALETAEAPAEMAELMSEIGFCAAARLATERTMTGVIFISNWFL